MKTTEISHHPKNTKYARQMWIRKQSGQYPQIERSSNAQNLNAFCTAQRNIESLELAGLANVLPEISKIRSISIFAWIISFSTQIFYFLSLITENWWKRIFRRDGSSRWKFFQIFPYWQFPGMILCLLNSLKATDR